MTISTEVRKAGPFIGNDSASVFPFAFKVFKAADLIVVRRQDNIGEEATLVLDSDYHVTLNGNQDTTPGGVVTLVAGALASGFTLVVSSELPYLQPTDLTNQGGFYPKVITNALDRLTIFCQQLLEITGRTLKLPITAPTNISAEIPLPNPSELIAWDETGTRLTTVSPQSLVTSIAYGSATADLFAGDGVTTTFPLSTNPASVNNLDVSVGGFSQRPVQGGIGDYSWNGGASITFASPPPAPTIPGDKNVLVRYMQAIPVSDSEALHAQTREALRRSYAEAGYNLVEGSFETGGTLASTSDVLLLESAGTAYAWTGVYPVGGYDVAPGIDPTVVPGFALRNNVLLRDELAEPTGYQLVGGIELYSFAISASAAAAKTIKDRFSRISIFVEDYSNLATGSDWTAAVQAAIDDSEYSTVVIPAGITIGKVYIRTNANLVSLGEINLSGANAGFYIDATLDIVSLDGVKVNGDNALASRHLLVSPTANANIGTLIVQRCKTRNTALGIVGAFDGSTATVGAMYTLFNEINGTLGQDPGEGYGIVLGADDTSRFITVGNVINNATRHSIYHSRYGNYITAMNHIRGHRSAYNVTSGTYSLLAAMPVFRCRDATVFGNIFEDCRNGCIHFDGQVVGSTQFDVENIRVFGNVIRRPLNAPPFSFGSIGSVSLGRLRNISVTGNQIYMADSNRPAAIFHMGWNLKFKDNDIFYRACSYRPAAFTFDPVGETAGAATVYSDLWDVSDNNIFYHNPSATEPMILFLFSANTRIATYLFDNKLATNATLTPIPVYAATPLTDHNIYMRGQRPDFASTSLIPKVQLNPSGSTGFRYVDAISTPVGAVTPDYQGQDLFLTQTQKFWKAKGLTVNDWLLMN